MYNNDDYAEKPYDFVEFSKDAPKLEKPGGQQKLNSDRLSGWLEIKLETLSPLQVAHGFLDFVKAGNTDHLAALQSSIQKFANGIAARRYIVPGSSLKGVVRSLVEAISQSCLLVVGRQSRQSVPKHLNRCNDVKNLCPACRLFGAQDYQGQLSFEDAEVPPNNLVLVTTPLLWSPARGGRGLPPRYILGQAAKGRKFYYHNRLATGEDKRAAIRTGAEIPTKIHFLNVKGAELGLLLMAMGINPEQSFPIKVGAAKPVGMGSIRVHLSQVRLLQGKRSIRSTGRLGGQSTESVCLSGEALQEHLHNWINSGMESLVLKDQLEDLSTILNEGGLDHDAPSGMY